MTTLCKSKIILMSLITSLLLTGCNSDVKIFREKVDPGKQIPVKAEELALDTYYVKDGTDFIRTLPLMGSASNALDSSSLSRMMDKSRVLYARPYEDTLIPTHYKGEIVAKASQGDNWDSVLLERFKDMGYSIGFFNATYSSSENAFILELDKNGLEYTDFYKKVFGLESTSIKIVEVNHKPITSENADLRSGILTNMVQGESYTLSLYSGTYYHEIDVVADTQMFQSFEVFLFGQDYISDTPNGYRSFETPEILKSGYYSINGSGLFRYVDFEKGQGDVKATAYNEKYYENSGDMLAQFSSQYSFTIKNRLENMTVAALYDESSVEDEDAIEGYIFAPDGTEYQMTLDTKKNVLKTDFTQAMPGKWIANIHPKTLVIKSFDAVDNSPDRELTQKEFTVKLDEAKENIVFKAYFKSKVGQKLQDVKITASMIAPDGETYIMSKTSEKTIDEQEKFFVYYIMPYAKAGEYVININYYPEKTEVEEPYTENNTETVTETIVIEG